MKQKEITAEQLWQPGHNDLWNSIAPYIVGKEQRGNIEPCKYFEVFMRGGRACVDGDTLISTPRGVIRIKDFSGGEIYAIDKSGNVVVTEACHPVRFNKESLYRVTLYSGRSFVCTAKHRVLTSEGWKSVFHVTTGQTIVSCLPLSTAEQVNEYGFYCSQKECDGLQEKHCEKFLLKSHEGVLHSTRRLLGFLYHYWCDHHLCDGLPQMEVNTFQDVLLQLADVQTHSQDDLHTDDLCNGDTNIRSCHNDNLHSTMDNPIQLEDKCYEDEEIESVQMLSGLLSVICSSPLQFHKTSSLNELVKEVSRLLLSSMRSSLVFPNDQSQCALEECTLQTLCDTLPRKVHDESYSDSLLKDVLNICHHHITYDMVVAIEPERVDHFYDMFVPIYNNYIGNGIVHHNSGKSYTASIWMMMALTNDHEKNAVVIRKVGSSIRKSCFEQVKKAIRRLELDKFWSINQTNLTMTHNVTKQKIVFVGADDEEKLRSITCEVGYFSFLWYEEAKQMTNYEEIQQARASILRGGSNESGDNSAEFITFLTYNPPKSRLEWINEEAIKNVPGRLVHSSTYLTMPQAWIGKNIIADAERLKQYDEKQYRYMYLGEAVGTTGTYFHNIRDTVITDEMISRFDYTDESCDWGTRDPNVWLRMYLDEDARVLWIFDEIYQTEEDCESQDTKIYEFARLVKDRKKEIGTTDDPCWCDCQGIPEMAIFNSEEFDIEAQPAPKQGANGRDIGYNFLRQLKDIHIDSSRCPNAFREFTMFESLELPGGKGWADKPGKKNDHCCDCVRYGLWQQILNEDCGD